MIWWPKLPCVCVCYHLMNEWFAFSVCCVVFKSVNRCWVCACVCKRVRRERVVMFSSLGRSVVKIVRKWRKKKSMWKKYQTEIDLNPFLDFFLRNFCMTMKILTFIRESAFSTVKSWGKCLKRRGKYLITKLNITFFVISYLELLLILLSIFLIVGDDIN